jgi:NADH dehydrogenase
VQASYEDAASLDSAFRGAGAVIHLAGVLVERRESTYEAANRETARRVVEAARRAGVGKLILVSAVGADATATNRYWRTKGEAEAIARTSGLPHTVLRVPLLLGHGTEGAEALRRRLRRATVVLVAGGRTLQQPLDVDDLARAAIVACEPDRAANRTLELVGPVRLAERELVERAARILGRRVRIRSLPAWLVRVALVIRQWARGPGFSPEALEVVTADTTRDPGPAARELGLTLTDLDTMLRHSVEPAGRP